MRWTKNGNFHQVKWKSLFIETDWLNWLKMFQTLLDHHIESGQLPTERAFSTMNISLWSQKHAPNMYKICTMSRPQRIFARFAPCFYSVDQGKSICRVDLFYMFFFGKRKLIPIKYANFIQYKDMMLLCFSLEEYILFYSVYSWRRVHLNGSQHDLPRKMSDLV